MIWDHILLKDLKLFMLHKITHKTTFTSAFVTINLAFELPWLLDLSPTLLRPVQRFWYKSKCSFSSLIQIFQLNCIYSWWRQLLWCVFRLLGHMNTHKILVAPGHFTNFIKFTMPTLLARTTIIMTTPYWPVVTTKVIKDTCSHWSRCGS